MTQEEFNKLFEKLTPDNKEKLIAKYNELIAEQVQKEVFYYFFDCLDGNLSDKYFTACELNKLLNGKEEPMTEAEIKRTAANYEATLYRYTLDKDGQPTNEVCLYDCFY